MYHSNGGCEYAFGVVGLRQKAEPSLKKHSPRCLTVKAELAKVQTAFADMQKERDTLKESLDKVTSEGASVAQLQEPDAAADRYAYKGKSRRSCKSLAAESKTTIDKLAGRDN